MPNSQRLQARVRAAVMYLVVYPIVWLAVSLVCVGIGYFASWLGTQ